MQNSFRIHDSKTAKTIVFLAIAIAAISLTSVYIQIAKADTLSVNITPSAQQNLDVGQHVVLTANPAGGSGNYTGFQWYMDGGAVGGAVGQTYDYTPISAGTVSVTVTVTDDSPATSVQSSPVTVVTEAAPTVSIAPGGLLILDAGQSQLFTATPNGGTAPIHYQWYQDGAPVGSDSSTYSLSQGAGLYLINCRVTDSADNPIISGNSNSASVTVNPTLNTPTAVATSLSMNRGQGSTLSATGISGGTSPYIYQWLSEAPGAGGFSPISGATSNTYLFSATVATTFGTWHFELQVTDSATTPVTVTSTIATIEVCPVVSFSTNSAMTGDASGTVLTIDSLPYTYNDLQTLQFTTWTAGSAHSVTATSPVSVVGGLKQYIFQNWANGNGLVTSSGTFTTPSADTAVLANYVPQHQIAVIPPLNGQITPNATAFYDAGTSQTFSINALSGYHINDVIVDGVSVGTNNSYAFNSISTHHTISANFQQNPPSTYTLTASAGPGGSINPSGQIIVTTGDTKTFTVTAIPHYHVNQVLIDTQPTALNPQSQFTISNITSDHTISASFTINSYIITVNSAHGLPTASSEINYGSNFKASVTSPEIIDSSSQWICTGFSIDGGAQQTGTSYTFTDVTADHIISFAWTQNFLSTVIATTSNGTTISIPVQGNLTGSQISNASVNSTPTSFTISLTITGPTGTAGFVNMTIPKNTLPTGYVSTPAVYMDGQFASNQGYTWDGTNFYIWYTIHFSTHQIALQFPVQPSPSPSPTPQPTPSPSPSPSATPSPTASPTPTPSPTAQPTATPQPTPSSTPENSPGATPPTATTTPTQTPSQTPTNNPTATPLNPTTSESAIPTQKPTLVPILPYERTRPTPGVQPDPSTAGILTLEMAGIFAIVLAILVVTVLIFKKAKR